MPAAPQRQRSPRKLLRAVVARLLGREHRGTGNEGGTGVRPRSPSLGAAQHSAEVGECAGLAA